MKEFFAADYTGTPFQLFGLPHLLALGVIVLINLSFFYFRPYFTEALRYRIRYGLALVLLLNEFAYHLWKLTTGHWTIQTMLPLHL